MKRFLTFVLTVAAAVSMTACGNMTDSASAGSSAVVSEEEGWKPEGAVTIYCPFAAGGSTDLALRCVADILTEQTGVSVSVLNRPGGAGVVGTTEFTLCDPDGYNIAMSSNTFFSTQPFLNTVEYKLDDFIPFIGLSEDPNLIVVKGDAPYDTLEEMVAYFKAHPEEKLLYTHSGSGGANHLGQAIFLAASGLENYETVPASSGSEGVTFVMGGHVTMAATSTVESASLLEAGEIKPLAVIGSNRLPFEKYKDIPTLAECGYDGSLCVWKFMALPADTPDEIVTYWYEQFEQAYADERWTEFCKNYSLIPNTELSHDEIIEKLEPEIESTHELLKNLGLAVK